MNEFIDMDETTVANSNQLNAIDIAEPRTITIRGVKKVGDEKQPIQIFFDGDNGKPFIPCLMMRRVLREMWGRNGADYVGRSLVVFNLKTVKYGGKEVGGIRISHASHIDRDHETIVRPARGVLTPYKVKALELDQYPDQAGPLEREDALTKARNVASCGKAAFVTWYNSDEGKQARQHISADPETMPILQSLAEEADALNDRGGL